MSLAEKIYECLENGIELNFRQQEHFNHFKLYAVYMIGEVRHWHSIVISKEFMQDEPCLIASIDDIIYRINKQKND